MRIGEAAHPGPLITMNFCAIRESSRFCVQCEARLCRNDFVYQCNACGVVRCAVCGQGEHQCPVDNLLDDDAQRAISTRLQDFRSEDRPSETRDAVRHVPREDDVVMQTSDDVHSPPDSPIDDSRGDDRQLAEDLQDFRRLLTDVHQDLESQRSSAVALREDLPSALEASTSIIARVSELSDGWNHFEHIHLDQEFKRRVFTLRRVPRIIRASYHRIQLQVLAHLQRLASSRHDIAEIELEKAWI